MSDSPATASGSTPRAPSRASVPIGAEIRGRLILRYKRFFADIETDDGEKLTVHCPNPGSMLGCAIPGSAVRCSTSDNPKRKLRHTLEMIRIGRVWVGLNTLRANRLVLRALQCDALPDFAGYQSIRPEVAVGSGSRLDFRLDDRPGDDRRAFIEVKSVTLAEGRRARFPDSVTTRGRRHMDTLARLQRDGSRAALLFVVQRADCDSVRPADDIDPEYGEALRAAVRAGVEVHAVRARVTARSLSLEGPLPVVL
jgi:sugar fermentation stimulation protein A